MPIPTSILSPGLSDDTNYALQLDTFSRFENMKMNAPMAYDLPETPDPPVRQARSPQADILSSTPVTIGEGLFSDDPKVQALANMHLQESLDKRNTKFGAGTPEFFPYDKSMDRFLAAESGYNPYISIADNEQYQYTHDYLTKGVFGRIGANIGKGFTRFGAGVALKTVQTLGYLGSMVGNGIMELVDGKDNQAMANIADNTLSRWAEDLETDMKNSDMLAVFKPRDWEDKGFFSKLGNGAFWSDEVADGAAFMGEMVASTFLLGGVGKLAGLGKLGATSIRMGANAGKFGKAVNFTSKFLTGADDIAGVGRWAFLTTSESAMESSHKYTEIRDRLTRERSEGKNTMSNEEIKAEAGNAAASLFKDNLLILGASSAFENRMIFGPLFGKKVLTAGGQQRWFGRKTTMSKGTDNIDDIARIDKRTYKYHTKLGEKLNLKDPTSRLRFYGGRAGGAIMAEGYWEENAQLAAERLADLEFYQEGGFITRAGQLGQQIGFQTKNASTWFGGEGDNQASTAIGLGAIIGGGATTLTTKAFGGDKKFVGERRQIISNVDESVKQYENARKKFLSFQDIYKREDDKVNEEGITTTFGKGKVVKDEFGDPVIDQTRAEDVLTGFYNFSTKMSDISDVQDPLYKKFLQDSALTDYVHAAKEVGVFDRAVTAFKTVGTKSAKELVELGFDPNTITDVGWMNNSIETIGKIYDEEMDEKKAKPLTESYTRFDDVNRRYAIYKNRSKIETSKKLADEYQAAITSPDFVLIDKDNPAINHPVIHEYNAALIRLRMLEQMEDSQVGSFYDGHIASQKKMLQDKLDSLRPSLQPDIDTGIITEGKDKQGRGDLLQQQDKRFMGEIETTPGTLVDIEYGAVTKYAQMINIIAQADFSRKSFEGEEGARAWTEFKEHMKKVGEVSAEADAAVAGEGITPPKPEDPNDPNNPDPNAPIATGKWEARGLEVYDPEGVLLRAFDTEQEAMDHALKLNQMEEDKKKEEARLAAEKKAKEEEEKKKKEEETPLTYEELKAQALKIIEDNFGIILAEENLGRIADMLATPEAVEKLTPEEVEWLTEFVKAHNEKMGKQPEPGQDAELEEKIAHLERRREASLAVVTPDDVANGIDTGIEFNIVTREYIGVYYDATETAVVSVTGTLEEVREKLNQLYNEELADLKGEPRPSSEPSTDDYENLDDDAKEKLIKEISPIKRDAFATQREFIEYFEEKRNKVKAAIDAGKSKEEILLAAGWAPAYLARNKDNPAKIDESYNTALRENALDFYVPTPPAPPAPPAPPGPPAGPPLTGNATVDAINAFFAGIGAGIDTASQDKIRSYVERIMAGEDFEKVMEGLGPSFRGPVTQLLAQLGWKPPAPPTPPSGPTQAPGEVPMDVLAEVRERFEKEREAMDKGITFEELMKLEGQQIHNNVINDKIDSSKNEGLISFVTSNPNELTADGKTLTTAGVPINLLRHNFLAKIASNKLNKDDFKISLQLSAKGNIYAVVTDKAGNVLTFNEEAEVGKGPMHLEFFIDIDLYNANNLPKTRNQVLQQQRKAPLTGTPVVLHPSFIINDQPRWDVLEILKDRIRQGTVLGSIDFALQGLLAREGQDNSYATIPKNVASQTASSLIEKGHVQGKQGDLLTIDTTINGVKMRGYRINFSLLRDISDPSKGTEIVEFRATRLGDAVTHDGKRLMDMKIMIGDKEVNFFQAALDGTLPSEPEHMKLLNTVLRPDKFTAINLGGTIMVVNLPAFKRFLTSDNVNAAELRKLTALDQIENSELNIFPGFYGHGIEVELFGDVLKDGNYMEFVNNNVKTSATMVKRGEGQEGYSRINKRIVVTLDDNFDDIMKKNNQRDVVSKGPDTVTTPGTDQATDAQKLAIMDEYLNKAAEDIEDDLTDNTC